MRHSPIALGLLLLACAPSEPSAGDEIGESEGEGESGESESGESESEGESGESESSETTDSDGTDTEGISPACEAGDVPVGNYDIDIDAFPEVEAGETLTEEGFAYEGECELVELELIAGEVVFDLLCAHTPEPVPVRIVATSQVLPSGVAVGDVLDFVFDLGVGQGGDASEPFYATITTESYVLADGEGAVFASAASNGLGESVHPVGPMTMSLIECAPFRFGDDAQGYWEAASATNTTTVAEGFVEMFEEDGRVWRISNFSSRITCCHGNDIDFSVLRQ